MRRFILLLTSVFLLFSCSIDALPEESEEHEQQEPHIGKWKLEERIYASIIILPSPSPLDCSSLNVFYEFKTDGVLEVSGIIEHPLRDWYESHIFHRFIPPGTHFYSVKPDNVSGRNLLLIDKITTYHFLEFYNNDNTSMGIGLTSVGGLRLTKVKK